MKNIPTYIELLEIRARRNDYSDDEARDPQGRWVASGNTYANKEHLKASGFTYNAANKVWLGGTAAKDKFEAGEKVGPSGRQITVMPKGVKIETTKEFNARIGASRGALTSSQKAYNAKEERENKAAYEKVFGKY